ncbi:DUF5719 family protein [Nocardioides sp. HM23]|uniref:DUF5719 family protein n=1 Tax=Nocardioides bizhenqiangii TaxID=3095076 RepID=UPI002ACAE60A|nr:DUF5719 family protein [Nocardioides sp. HM23]MDZ5621207.1 DUF5719 family protein [Nocardioides sp. HM23]
MSDGQQGRRADRAGATGPGRRGIVQRRKVDALLVLALVLPIVVAGALAVTRGDDPATTYAAAPPSPARLTDASLVCAAASSSTAGDVMLSRVPGMRGGDVTVRVAEGEAVDLGGPRNLEVRTGELASVASDGDVLATGTAAAAPGLVGGRTGPARAAAECRAPTFDEWYVGIGAAAKQSSTIELANPDEGPAVVEIALHGRPGPLIEQELHGIRVAGHQVMRLDLSQLTPRRGTLAAHLTVVRGRVVSTVRHTYDPLGRGTPRIDFLPAQAAPATENLLLGVPSDGDGVVNLFNPGDDEARATVRVVSDSAIFTPAGLDEVVVPGGTVRQLPLSQVLTREAADGALGLQVVAAQPLVASVRVVGDDLGLIAPSTAIADDQPVTAVVPEGPKSLVLAGAERAGVVRVTATDARGEVLMDEQRVEVGADRGHSLELPDDAVLVTVRSTNTTIAGTVMLTGDRIGALRLWPADIDADVPVVRPE